MANETAQASQTTNQQGDAARQTQRPAAQTAQRPTQEVSQGGSQPSNLPTPMPKANRPATATRQNRSVAVHQPAPDFVFDPHGAIRVGMLKLARNWASEGHVYSAINTYREVLTRYPGTGVADAAVEDMLELAGTLEERGMYFTALNLFHTMEELI